jgi:hypothetical protein
MTRISKDVKSIADAHIEARMLNKFDNPVVRTRSEFMEQLYQGKTFESLMDSIESRYVSVTSTIASITLRQATAPYRRAVYEGFKAILQA